MKKIILSIIAAVSFSLILSSCSDWLTLNPHDAESDETAITNLGDAQIALNGVYYMIRTSPLYGREAVVIGDAGTPDVTLKLPNSNRFVNVYNWQNPQPGGAHFTDVYVRAYRAIDAANKVILRTEGLSTDTPAEENVKKQILGEAHLLRALVHFEILKYFSHAYNYTADGSHLGIVYMHEPTITNNHARSTSKESFEYIIEDAKEAVALMTVDSPAEPFSAGSLAAEALLARVYLYKAGTTGSADFAEAKIAAEKVINSGKYTLATPAQYTITGTTSFASPMWLPAAGFSSESILTIPFLSVATERLYTTALSRIYLDSNKGYGDLLPSNEIVALMGTDAADVRNSIFYEYDYSGVATPCVRKFFGPIDNWDLANYNIFRISEMYLIAAEAAARAGNDAPALVHLNLLKTNRGVATISGLTGQALIDEILLERRKELCFEGHRLADLKRLNLGVVRGTDTNNPGNQDYSVAYPDYRFAFPIPTHEMDVNKDMVQNPGY